jgi:hypothetical protein
VTLAGTAMIAVGGLAVLGKQVYDTVDALQTWAKGLVDARKAVSPTLAIRDAQNKANLQIDRIQMINGGFGSVNGTDTLDKFGKAQGQFERQTQEAGLIVDEIGINLIVRPLTQLVEYMSAKWMPTIIDTLKSIDEFTEQSIPEMIDSVMLQVTAMFDANLQAAMAAVNEQKKLNDTNKRRQRDEALKAALSKVDKLFGAAPEDKPPAMVPDQPGPVVPGLGMPAPGNGA